MPTGYTAAIIDGTINTFPEFAKQCMKAFGAVMHMRDEPFDKEYYPAKPSDYHDKALKASMDKLKVLIDMPDEELGKMHKDKLLENKNYHIKEIEKAIKAKERIDAILYDVKKWTPPTKDHQGLKDFMIQQLESTISYDCDCGYHEKELAKIEPKLADINFNLVRNEMIEEVQGEIDYHKKHLKEEVKRCESSNKWVADLLKSL